MKPDQAHSTRASEAPPWLKAIGNAGVGIVRSSKRERVTISLLKDAAAGHYAASEEAQDTATGQTRVIRSESFTTEAAALKTCRQWAEEFRHKYTAPRRAKAAQMVNKSPPEGCEVISGTDVEDESSALLAEVAENYPNCAKVFRLIWNSRSEPDRARHRNRIADAFRLDVARLTGIVDNELSGPVGILDANYVEKLHAALHAPRRRITIRDDVNADLRLNWYALRYCFMTEQELADRINERHITQFTPRTIAARRRRLGLTTKRQTGRLPPERIVTHRTRRA